jgi:putative transposase
MGSGVISNFESGFVAFTLRFRDNVPRRPRIGTGGLTFHVMNRAARRLPLFESRADYAAFERILIDAVSQADVALYAYCLMPNHWHLVVSPRSDGALSRFMHWLTTTHARRWRLARRIDGQGAVYQGRFRALLVTSDEHFLSVCRYVERNALRASLVERAEEWRWSSLWRRCGHADAGWLSSWLVREPIDWLRVVNAPQTARELEACRGVPKRPGPLSKFEMTPDPISGFSTRK